MKVCLEATIFVLLAMLFLTFVPVMAGTLVWEGEVPSTGVGVVSSVLEYGKLYHIVAEEVWWYNYPDNLAADAQYYTTDFSNSWNWGNHFPEPSGHSFLQINGHDVNWGPFSNGNDGHRYSIPYTGEGTAITFRIVDWMDGNYGNNDCKLIVKIYEDVTVGGYVVDSNPFEIAASWVIGLLMLAAGITVPIIKYYRRTYQSVA